MKTLKWIKQNVSPIFIFIFMLGFAKEYFDFTDPFVLGSFLILSCIWPYIFENMPE